MSPARRRTLGRGLDALLDRSSQATAAKAEESDAPVTVLPLDALEPNRLQPRTDFDEPALAALAASIKAQGVIQPLIVVPEGDHYAIIAGERRYRAAKRAGLLKVPVVVRQPCDDQKLLELALVENLQREDLNAVEEAEAFQLLLDSFGLSQKDVAVRVGKSRTTVANSVRLLKLPEAVQAMVRRGELTAGQVRPLLALDSPKEQVAFAKRAKKDALSARQMEELVGDKQPAAKRSSKKASRSLSSLDANSRAAVESMIQTLQTKVDLQRKGAGGILRIHFHSEEELMRIYEHLTQGDA